MKKIYEFLDCLLNGDGDGDSSLDAIKVRIVSTFFWKDLQVPTTIMEKSIFDAVVDLGVKINIISSISIGMKYSTNHLDLTVW